MHPSRFVRWWQENPDKAEGIRERRRHKYATDETFRERERERKRSAYARKKTSTGKKFPKPKIHWHEGSMIELWSVGAVADRLGVHKRTLAAMEARGALPINRLVDDNGRRWWPETYINWLKPYFILKQTGRLSTQEFNSRVWNDWSAELKRGEIHIVSEEKDDREGPTGS